MIKGLIKRLPILLAIFLIASIVVSVSPQSAYAASKLIGTDDGAVVGYTSFGYVIFTRYQAVNSGGMTLFYMKAGTGGNIKCALYTDNNGEPDALITAMNTGQTINAGWSSVSFTSTDIVGGTYYWLAFCADSNISGYTGIGSGTRRYKAATYSVYTFPNPAGNGYGADTYGHRVAGWGDEENIPLPQTTQVADFYGDSITVGIAASNIGVNDWASIVSSTMGYIKNNQAVSSTELADMINTMYSATQTSSSISFGLLGYNDMNHVGSSADGQLGFQRELYSAVAKLAIPTDNIKWGQDSSIIYSGTWANQDAGWGSHTKSSNTNGSAATVSLAGSIVYIDIMQYTGFTRGINVNIDGVDKGTFNGSTFVTAISGKNYAPYLLRFAGLVDTSHNIVLTVTDGTGFAYINWIASLSGLPQTTYPKVYIGNTLRNNATGYTLYPPWNNGSDVAVISFNNIISSVVSNLANDGLNIKYVDACATYNLTTDVCGDNRHPNDSGHSHIATAFLNSISGVTPPPVNLPVVTALSVSATVSQWDGNFNNNGLFAGSVSKSYRYNIVNSGSATSVFTVSSDAGFYQSCLQVSVDNTNWTNVGTGWQTPIIQSGANYPVWFRVNVLLSTSPATYTGHINFVGQ